MTYNTDLSNRLLSANKNKEEYIRKCGYNGQILSQIDDDQLQYLINEENLILKQIKIHQTIEIIENSYFFANNNDFWVDEMKSLLMTHTAENCD